MILCLAANTSVDKTFEVERVLPGSIHRPVDFHQMPGGKGLNCARVIHAAGGQVRIVGLLAGHAGQWIQEELDSVGIPSEFIWTQGETRACLSVVDRGRGELSEFYESGPDVDASTWGRVEDTLVQRLPESSWLALCGSVPPGVDTSTYARLVAAAHNRGVDCAVDAYGPLLRAALEEGPTVVKINRREAREALPGDANTNPVSLATALRRRAAAHTVVAITLGACGAVLTDSEGHVWRGRAKAEGVHSVASGDAFLAGLLTARDQGHPWRRSLAVALGAAGSNAETPGAGRLSIPRMHELAGSAHVERLF